MTRKENQSPETISIKERYPRLKEIPDNGYPNHVLIIPDRNRTFAARVLLSNIPILGHIKGAEVLEKGLLDLWELPIPNISIWGASEDNVTERKSDEMSQLLQLERSMISKNLVRLQEYGVQLIHVGRKDRLPPDLLRTIQEAEEQTKNNPSKTLRLLIDYGEAYRQREYNRRLAQTIINMGLPRGSVVTDDLIAKIHIPEIIPPINCVIRTLKEEEDIDFFKTSAIGRIADSAIWIPIRKYFPQVTTEDVVDALIRYSKVEQRKGGDSKTNRQ